MSNTVSMRLTVREIRGEHVRVAIPKAVGARGLAGMLMMRVDEWNEFLDNANAYGMRADPRQVTNRDGVWIEVSRA